MEWNIRLPPHGYLVRPQSNVAPWTSRVSRLPRTGRMRFPDEDVNEALLLHVRDD